jgi:hypothetical protein
VKAPSPIGIRQGMRGQKPCTKKDFESLICPKFSSLMIEDIIFSI